MHIQEKVNPASFLGSASFGGATAVHSVYSRTSQDFSLRRELHGRMDQHKVRVVPHIWRELSCAFTAP